MSERVSDEMLMAFVDGELDAAGADAVRRAVADDSALADRAAAFRMTRDMAKAAFADVRTEPVPEALVASVIGRRPAENGGRLSRRRVMQAALPLTASIALLFGAGGYWYGQQGPAGTDPFARSTMTEALAATRSGEHRTIPLGAGKADFTTLATYEVEGGLCRMFQVSGEQLQAWRGVGCNRGGDWTVELTVAQAAGNGNYMPASNAGLSSIDAFLDALEARPVDETN